MSEEMFVRQCAPTLAGVKTGSLFSCPYDTREGMTEDVRRLNRVLVPKGLRLLPLRYSEKRVLLYLYRPTELWRDLNDDKAAEILDAAGYSCTDCDRCVVKLIQRLRGNKDFPHEIGLFLSYPPEDVKGFIDNNAANFKYSGLWKVYGDEKRAKAMFEKFKKCTDIYCRMWTGLRYRHEIDLKGSKKHEENSCYLLERHRQHRGNGRGCPRRHEGRRSGRCHAHPRSG